MIANQHGQSLTSHLAGVALLSKHLCLEMGLKDTAGLTFPNAELRSEWDLTKIAEECFWAGLYHDVGKIDPFFQEYLKTKADESSVDGVHISGEFRSTSKKTKLKKKDNFNALHPYHHEVSWALMRNLDTKIGSRVEHAVFYHHAKRINDEFKTSEKILEVFDNSKDLIELSIAVIKESAKKAGREVELSSREGDDTSQIPEYKKFQLKNQTRQYQWAFNTIANLIRMTLVNADQMVSSLTKEELEDFLETKDYSIFNLSNDSTTSLNFDEVIEKYGGTSNPRLQKQIDVVQKLKTKTIPICGAPAGSGKTLMSLLFANNSAKKILYIAPRVTICQELFKSLTSDEYPHPYSVEILTGDHKEQKTQGQATASDEYELMTSDIVITTIDSVIRLFSSHKKANLFLKTFSGTIVFDEFHEIRNLPSMFYTFGEILYTFLLKKESNLLLMSATPDPVFLNQFGISPENILKMDTFNQQKYKINLINVNNFYNEQKQDLYDQYLNELVLPEGSAIILDSVDKVQELFCKHQNSTTHLAHSRMTYADRQKMMNTLYANFGKSVASRTHRVFSGPIIKASLNISFKELFLTICSPNDVLQSLGRLNRFGEDFVGKLHLHVPRTKKGDLSTAGFHLLKEVDYSDTSAKAFVDFLVLKIKPDQLYSLSEIYELYYEFFATTKINLQEDFVKIKDSAYKFIVEQDGLVDKKILHAPLEKKKSLANSLRGESVFVNAVVIRDFVDTGHLYDPKNIQEELLLTVSPDQGMNDAIKRFGSPLFSNSNRKKILKFLGLPEHLSRNTNWIDVYFKNPETPCYLSFSENEEKSKEIKGLDVNEELIYYYLNSDNVAVGLVSQKIYKRILGFSRNVNKE